MGHLEGQITLWLVVTASPQLNRLKNMTTLQRNSLGFEATSISSSKAPATTYLFLPRHLPGLQGSQLALGWSAPRLNRLTSLGQWWLQEFPERLWRMLGQGCQSELYVSAPWQGRSYQLYLASSHIQSACKSQNNIPVGSFYRNPLHFASRLVTPLCITSWTHFTTHYK